MSDLTANPGYAQGQLARALVTARSHEDAATRNRADSRVSTWARIFQGMLDAHLNIGSRTPLTNVPAWATLRVVGGGFATGELLAGDELQDHEHERLTALPVTPRCNERGLLNGHYLSDAGQEELRSMLQSGRYRINVPEEGALLVVAWLLGNGFEDEAREVLDQIGPFMGQLRFYPVPADEPEPTGSSVHLLNVGQMSSELRLLKTRPQAERYREAVTVWMPLYDRVVSLFAETVEDDWPCQIYPEGWSKRAQAALSDYERLRRTHRLCGKPDHYGHNFRLLRDFMKVAVHDGSRLSGRQVGLIRKILSDIKAKRGLPGSPSCNAVREMQQKHLQPGVAETARLVVERLRALPQDQGLDSLESVCGPITAAEASRFNLPAGMALPQPLCEKLLRCVNAPLAELVGCGVITSAEVLAKVVPQVSSQVQAASICDPLLPRLYASIYRAFRQRRSLMLFDLQHQVRIEELPWVAALNRFRSKLDTQEVARQALKEVAALALNAWPEQILPNKLIQELAALVTSSGLNLPVTEELAADIFMGEFSAKFVQAAKVAARLLDGTLYARYYRLPYDRVLVMEDQQPRRRTRLSFLHAGAATSNTPGFAELCFELAGAGARSYRAAENGKVVEQQQLLTTHNLAALFDTLGLKTVLADVLETLPRKCFTFIVRSRLQKVDDWKSQLQSVKNCAYAWRQMMFFLTMLPESAVADFICWADSQLSEQGGTVEATMRPLLEGLVLAQAGIKLTPVAAGHTTPHRFLGWSTERHWMLAPKA